MSWSDLPWEVISESNDLGEKVPGISLLKGRDLRVLWEFFHLYYVVNRTLKVNFYVDFSKERIELFFTPVGLLGDLAKPRFLPKLPVNYLPEEIKTFVRNPSDVEEALRAELTLLTAYNARILGVDSRVRLETFSKQKNEQFLTLKDVCDYFGIYWLYEWDVSEKVRTIIEGILIETAVNADARRIHTDFERIYNFVTSQWLSVQTASGTEEIRHCSNVQLKIEGTVYQDCVEIDMLFFSPEKRELVCVEVTSHSMTNNDEWKEHFRKKSALANILNQQAASKGWRLRYVYLFSYGFSDSDKAFGVKDFDKEASPFIFLPMWDFSQYRRFLDFKFKEWVGRNNKDRVRKVISEGLAYVANELSCIVGSLR